MTEDLAGVIGISTYTVTVVDVLGETLIQGYYVPNFFTIWANQFVFDFYDVEIIHNTACIGPPNGAVIYTPLTSYPFNWVWSNGASGTTVLTGLSAGNYNATVTLGNCTDQTSVSNIISNLPDAPLLTAAITNPTCGLLNGSIDLTVTDGEPPYTIAWSNGATTEDIGNLPPGTYTVTVTGANGCTAVEYYALVDSPTVGLTADVTPLSSCTASNGAIDLTPSPPGSYTYLWNTGAGTEDLSGLAAGTYSVTATDGMGCTSTAQFTVADGAQPPALSAVPTAATCGLGTGSVGLTASGGQPPYAFSWSNGATTEDISNVPPGTYAVTVTGANGCSATATATVADNAVNISVTGTATPSTTCTGVNGTVNATVSPTAPPVGSYTYVWSNGAATEDIGPVGPGAYTLTVNVGTCTASASFTVADQPSVPSPFATAGPEQCGGGNGSVGLQVGGGQPPYAYLWSNMATGEDLSGLAAGQYSVTVTGANGCTATATATVAAESVPVFVDGATTPNTSCTAANGSVATSVGPPVPPPGLSYGYLWATGEQSPGLSGLQAGSYSVTVTLGANCTASASFTVDSGPQLPSLSLSATPADCGGPGSVDLTVTSGTAPYGFLWSNSATTEDLPSAPAGGYTVTVTGADGCSATASATVPIGGVADTTSIYGTSCDLNEVGTSQQLLMNINGCDSLVITTIAYSASDTTNIYGTSCDLNDVGISQQLLMNINGCDSLIITTIAYSASDTTNIYGTSCDLNDVGISQQLLTNINGCDSLVITTITYSAADTINIYGTSCDLNDVGISQQLLVNNNGCDSLIITTITYSTADTTNIYGTSCDLNDVGISQQLLTNINGCDSLIITTITYSAADTTNIYGTSCDLNDVGTSQQLLLNSNGCDSLIITTVTYSASDTTLLSGTSCNPASVGVFTQNLVNVNGCDSTVIQTIAYSLSDTTLLTATSCDPAQTGIFTQNLSTWEGCDSTVITTVGLLPSAATSLTATTCDATQAGVFIQNLLTWQGCDSTVTITVTLLPSANSFLSATTCDPTQAGIFTQTLSTWQGCDSTVTTTVTLLPSATTSLSATTCDAAQAGIFTQNLTTWQGCDSTVTTTVLLLPSTSTSLTATTCDQTQAGVFTQNLTTWQGCDSTVTTTVTLLPNATTSLTATTCDATQAGVFTQNLTTWQGCDSTVTTTVAWSPPPALALTASDFNGFGVSCEGSSDGWAQVSASGIPPFGYAWQNGSTSPLLEGLAPGQYLVTATDGNGCTAAASVDLKGPEPLMLSLAVNGLDCFGNSSGGVFSTASGGAMPYSYLLRPMGTTGGSLQLSGSFGGLGAGTYEVVVEDANGCTATELVAINAPVPPSVELGEDIFIELGDGTTLEAVASIPWDSLAQVDWSGGGDPECPGCPQWQVLPLATTAYSITVVDGQGCLASDGLTVYVDRTKSVYVPNAFSPNGDGINDLLLLFAKQGQVKEVKSFLVFDRWGESVYRFHEFQLDDPDFGWDGSHRGEALNAAVFVWFAEVEFVDGEVGLFEGDVVLVK